MKKILMMILAAAFGLGAWGVTVTTEAELRTAIASGGTVELGGNIALTGGEIAVGTTVTLDLGTYTISAASGNIFQVVANGNFTVNADDTNPGGLTVGTTNACVYTAYGLNPGPKSVVLNGGVFTGNCVFNFSQTAANNVRARYGIDVSGYGSGEKADPTSVTINGGTFAGGYALGNVGAYRCYYFTVNGGTFERGLDCADTTTCSIGVTTTCKAFFTGGRYKNRYPTFRMKWDGLSTVDDPGKVFIGSASHTNVYYYADGYYVNAYDYSGCAGTGTYAGADVQGVNLFTYFATQCCQRWYNHSKTWHFLTQADAESVGVSDFTPVNGSDGVAQPQSVVAAPEAISSLAKGASVRSAARLLSSSSSGVPLAKGNSESDTFVQTGSYTVKSIAEYASTFSAPINEAEREFYDRSDLDACYVFDGDNDYSAYYLVTRLDKAVEAKSLKFYIGVGVNMGGWQVYAREIGEVDGNKEYILTPGDDTFLNSYFSDDSFSFVMVDFPFLVAVEDVTGNNVGTSVTVELRKSETGAAVSSFTHVINAPSLEDVPPRSN